MSKYMKPRARRSEARTIAGRFRGGKLAPVGAHAFRESESGSVMQSVHFELDPIPGRMITPITAELVSVFVPVQAIDALKNPTDDYPGNAEVIRQKLLSGVPLFDLEEENEISKRLGIVPRSIDGVKYVNEAARLAHNAAVNYLRRRKFVDAVQLDASSTAMTPALIAQTVLDRLNGVLDPENRVNGLVNLDLEGQANVSGILVKQNPTADTNAGPMYELSPDGVFLRGTGNISGVDPNSTQSVFIQANSIGVPEVFAELAGSQTSFSTKDLYNAERMDALTREMRQIVDDNPEHGQELVTRFAHGLSMDVGKQPIVVYERQVMFGMDQQPAMDGANLGVSITNSVAKVEFAAPIPATEFGGILITFAAVKPDEALASQPHPFLSDTWGATNYVADEMAIDPVPVTIRELDGDCAQIDEGTVALYVANNGLKRTYINYGFNRALDPTTVAAKSAIWQLEVPMSVTPESVIYPEDLDHYPFADNLAEVCTYTWRSVASVNTPIIFGPTPVEELAQIETDNIFQDA
ncbi:hypothetical protein [Nioella nitratireducens]|uniref:hypothetical protein n=1 Tax=Nioella nitratireducens TaxID=1287720 RepID=UPI0008FD60E0|nr:hypothetical protein [Nioella nitratireducens]